MAKRKRKKHKRRKPISEPISVGEGISPGVRKEEKAAGGKSQRFLFFLIPVLMVLSGALLIFTFSSSKERVKRKRDLNVLLIIIDTLRADRVGYSGYEIETPHIDFLGLEGARFLNTLCQYPMTLPSHASILTSTFPQYHGIKNNGNYYLGERFTTLAEILKEKGYLTSAFIGAVVLESKFGLAQGFDHYDDTFRTPEHLKIIEAQNLAEDVFQSASSWFERNYQERFFMWVHFYDPHAPYTPPSPYKEKYPEAYDGEVAYTDFYVGRLIEMLRERDVYGKTLIILTGDHGEGLNEHEEITHGIFLYDTTLKVPLVFHCPGVVPKGGVIEEQVRTVDIMPTILDILGIKIPAGVQGESLIPLIEERRSEGFDSYAETYFPLLSNGWSPLKAVRTERYKYIQAPQPELYDVLDDPQELRNIVREKAGIAKEMGERLEELERMFSSAEASPKRALSFEEREKLRALGYIDFYEEGDIKKTNLPDPKDKIKIFNQIQTADNLLGEGKFKEAGEILKSLLPLEPDNPGLHFLLAQLHFRNAEYEEAIQELIKVLQINSRNTTALLQLGLCYLNIHKPYEAEREFEKIFQITPQDIDSLSIISTAYKDKGNLAKSLEYIEKAVALDKENIKLRLQYAETLDLMGEEEKALREFELIREKDPANPQVYLGLGLFYMNRGIYEKGIASLEKSLQLLPSPEIYFSLGLSYKMIGKNKEAVESLKKYLELAPPAERERKKLVQKILSSMGE
jgi:arylsulfatase A-like enzyme/Tfp pilus assembly protein PilF